MSGYIDYQGATPDFPAFEGLAYEQWLEEADEVKEIVEWGLLEEAGDLFYSTVEELINLHAWNDHQRTSVNGQPDIFVDKVYDMVVKDFIRLDSNKVLAEGYENYRASYEPDDDRPDREDR